jgi:hypothetical protein
MPDSQLRRRNTSGPKCNYSGIPVGDEIARPSVCRARLLEVTINVCPSGWVCQAVRALGSNVTNAPKTRAGSGGSNRGSIRTEPVKFSAGPLREGREPLRLISIVAPLT